MLNVAALLVSAGGGELGCRRDANRVEQVGDRTIGNATVNREADLTGAAGRIAGGAVGDSGGERAERVRVHVWPCETFVASKSAATDIRRDHHVLRTGPRNRRQLRVKPHPPG